MKITASNILKYENHSFKYKKIWKLQLQIYENMKITASNILKYENHSFNVWEYENHSFKYIKIWKSQLQIYENMKITASIPIVLLVHQRVEFKVDKSTIEYKKQGRKYVNNHFMKRKMENPDSQFSTSLQSKISKLLSKSKTWGFGSIYVLG
jgi:hypothetical protein